MYVLALLLIAQALALGAVTVVLRAAARAELRHRATAVTGVDRARPAVRRSILPCRGVRATNPVCRYRISGAPIRTRH